MSDVHSPDVRSYNMSRIHGKDTKPEELVRKYLFSKGFRYRKNDSRLPGKPDIVLPKYKTVVFVNGCFWHGHTGCRYFVWPKNNAEFWRKKILDTKARDAEANRALKDMGWNIIVIWECEIKEQKLNALESIVSELKVLLKTECKGSKNEPMTQELIE